MGKCRDRVELGNAVGNFEVNSMAKISFAGNELYYGDEHTEYAGLEYSTVENSRFFILLTLPIYTPPGKIPPVPEV